MKLYNGQDVLNPVLLEPGEYGRTAGTFVCADYDPLLLEKAEEGHDGVRRAVELLLTRAPVAIVHVDVSQVSSDFANPGTTVYRSDTDKAIGFNDHSGGSESDFKIVLNGTPNASGVMHVLFSPPDEQGNPTNLTFRRADMHHLSQRSSGPYEGIIPNPMKTGGAAQARGFADYRYYLFGDSSTVPVVCEAFQDAGFDFSDDPYEMGLGLGPLSNSSYLDLAQYALEAEERLGEYNSRRFWPGDQFAEQIRNLGLEVPKLDPNDYPFVKPENQI